MHSPVLGFAQNEKPVPQKVNTGGIGKIQLGTPYDSLRNFLDTVSMADYYDRVKLQQNQGIDSVRRSFLQTGNTFRLNEKTLAQISPVWGIKPNQCEITFDHRCGRVEEILIFFNNDKKSAHHLRKKLKHLNRKKYSFKYTDYFSNNHFSAFVLDNDSNNCLSVYNYDAVGKTEYTEYLLMRWMLVRF